MIYVLPSWWCWWNINKRGLMVYLLSFQSITVVIPERFMFYVLIIVYTFRALLMTGFMFYGLSFDSNTTCRVKERGSTIYKVFMFYTLIFLNTCWGPGFMIYVLQFWWYLLVDFDLQKSTISWHVGGLCFIFTRLFEQDTVRIYVLYFTYKIFVRWLTALCKLHGLCFKWKYELWLQG